MKLTKLGHCCMLIEEKGLRILTDPGMYTVAAHEQISGIDVILITHEHADHFHLASLQELLKRNPQANVICNPSLGRILEHDGVPHKIVGDSEASEEKGVMIEGIGSVHATIHESLPQMQNTGYVIADTFWYPGDAFTNPNRPIKTLALPVAGPWMKTSEAVDYALSLKPSRVVPVHDAVLNPALLASGVLSRWYGGILESHGIAFSELVIGEEYDV